jgi:DHA2 family multidrug resistance protein
MAVARNLGGSIGLAVLAGLQEKRLDLHHWQLNAAIGANDPEVQRQLSESAAMFGGGADGLSAAYIGLNAQVVMQALVMTFNDMFLMLAIVCLLVVPLAWFLRTPAGSASLGAMH